MAPKRILLVALCILSFVVSASNGFAMPLFSGTSKQAVFLSPLEKWMPTWRLDAYVSPLEHAGYHVDVLFNENVSVAFLRTGLSQYDLIVLRTDSFTREGLDFFCSGEPVTSQSRTVFANEISLHELEVSACIGFSVAFLHHYYTQNSLREGLVYVLGGPSAELSSAFLEGGASAFIGYYEPYSVQWGRMDAYSQKLISYLSQGYDVEDAVLKHYLYLHTGHGNTADWPMPYWSGDGNFKI